MPSNQIMPTVDFYLIDAETEEAQMRFACRLLDKAYSQNNTVYVRILDQALANSMNDMLWTFRDISFVPHDLLTGVYSSISPIVIGMDEKITKKCDILFNLHPETTAAFCDYKRIVEIVYQEDSWQKLSRQHYKFYKNKGCSINTHDLRQ